MSQYPLRSIVLCFSIIFLAACSKGGEVALESGGNNKDKNKGSPYVVVNQGGKALIVEQGKSASTGVHGWVAIQTMTSENMRAPSGETAVMNKASAYQK